MEGVDGGVDDAGSGIAVLRDLRVAAMIFTELALESGELGGGDRLTVLKSGGDATD